MNDLGSKKDGISFSNSGANRDAGVAKSKRDKKAVKVDGLYQCLLCKRQGKPMFFATKIDLEIHIRRVHWGQHNFMK